jgi:hypothetical protein
MIIFRTETDELQPLLPRPHLNVRRYIARCLLDAYFDQFMFIGSNYVTIIIMFIVVTLFLSFKCTSAIVCINTLYLCARASLLIIGMITDWCSYNWQACPKLIYSSIYLGVAFCGLFISTANMFAHEATYVLGVTVILSLIDIFRFITYLIFFCNIGHRSINAMHVRYIELLNTRKIQYNIGSVYHDTLIFQTGDCPICLEPYVEGILVSVLECGHYYHTSCIGQWLPRMNTCPLCRSTVSHV